LFITKKIIEIQRGSVCRNRLPKQRKNKLNTKIRGSICRGVPLKWGSVCRNTLPKQGVNFTGRGGQFAPVEGVNLFRNSQLDILLKNIYEEKELEEAATMKKFGNS
jgi:hypothetical protein